MHLFSLVLARILYFLAVAVVTLFTIISYNKIPSFFIKLMSIGDHLCLLAPGITIALILFSLTDLVKHCAHFSMVSSGEKPEAIKAHEIPLAWIVFVVLTGVYLDARGV